MVNSRAPRRRAVRLARRVRAVFEQLERDSAYLMDGEETLLLMAERIAASRALDRQLRAFVAAYQVPR